MQRGAKYTPGNQMRGAGHRRQRLGGWLQRSSRADRAPCSVSTARTRSTPRPGRCEERQPQARPGRRVPTGRRQPWRRCSPRRCRPTAVPRLPPLHSLGPAARLPPPWGVGPPGVSKGEPWPATHGLRAAARRPSIGLSAWRPVQSRSRWQASAAAPRSAPAPGLAGPGVPGGCGSVAAAHLAAGPGGACAPAPSPAGACSGAASVGGGVLGSSASCWAEFCSARAAACRLGTFFQAWNGPWGERRGTCRRENPPGGRVGVVSTHPVPPRLAVPSSQCTARCARTNPPSP